MDTCRERASHCSSEPVQEKRAIRPQGDLMSCVCPVIPEVVPSLHLGGSMGDIKKHLKLQVLFVTVGLQNNPVEEMEGRVEMSI